MKILIQPYHSPCGELTLGETDGKLCLCHWTSDAKRQATERRLQRMLNAEYETRQTELLQEAARQLDEYFAKQRKQFDIPLLTVGTEFQKQVWHTLTEIPYGKTLSYGEEAARLGRAKAVRAVANANGANALSIFIPCHRVVGSNHTLTGYGGGLPAKQYLLELEQSQKSEVRSL